MIKQETIDVDKNIIIGQNLRSDTISLIHSDVPLTRERYIATT